LAPEGGAEGLSRLPVCPRKRATRLFNEMGGRRRKRPGRVDRERKYAENESETVLPSETDAYHTHGRYKKGTAGEMEREKFYYVDEPHQPRETLEQRQCRQFRQIRERSVVVDKPRAKLKEGEIVLKPNLIMTRYQNYPLPESARFNPPTVLHPSGLNHKQRRRMKRQGTEEKPLERSDPSLIRLYSETPDELVYWSEDRYTGGLTMPKPAVQRVDFRTNGYLWVYRGEQRSHARHAYSRL